MRIIGGKFKGKKILEPKDKQTRPLKDLTKESIFNIINHSNKFSININKANVLDLFSGVGCFGIECLSQGARHLGNYIINGPNVKNFKEIYTFLNNLKMSSSTSNILSMEDIILKKLKTKTNNKNIKKIIKIGNDILEKNLFHINKYLI